MGRKGKAVAITNPHNLKNAEEAKRIKDLGGITADNGNGNLRLSHPIFQGNFMSIAVTRALGDLIYKLPLYVTGNQLFYSMKSPDFFLVDRETGELKQSGLIAEPDITQVQLSTDDQFLILASDGFWDVVPETGRGGLCDETSGGGCE